MYSTPVVEYTSIHHSPSSPGVAKHEFAPVYDHYGADRRAEKLERKAEKREMKEQQRQIK